MADIVNRNVTEWFATDYVDLNHIHTGHDYVLSTDMIQLAIENNLRLSKKRAIRYSP